MNKLSLLEGYKQVFVEYKTIERLRFSLMTNQSVSGLIALTFVAGGIAWFRFDSALVAGVSSGVGVVLAGIERWRSGNATRCPQCGFRRRNHRYLREWRLVDGQWKYLYREPTGIVSGIDVCDAAFMMNRRNLVVCDCCKTYIDLGFTTGRHSAKWHFE